MRRLLVAVFLISADQAGVAGGVSFESLRNLATQSLETNIIQLDNGKKVVVAGQHQFKTVWTRDFAWASRGLMAIGHADVVRGQLEQIISVSRETDGLVPRGMDSMNPKLRAFGATVLCHLKIPMCSLPIKSNLKAEYEGEHGTPAFDGNVLILLAALDYVRVSGDTAWWNSLEDRLVKIYHFYDSYFDKDLIKQPAYSDCQDSASRVGKTFYLNMLYYVLSEKLLDHPRFGVDKGRLKAIRKQIELTFYDPDQGVYRTIEGLNLVSLDSNLLALDYNYLAEKSPAAVALYESLKHHPLFTKYDNMPGFWTFPDYPSKWVSGITKAVGLRHYHDDMVWSILIGKSAKIAIKMGDLELGKRLLTLMETLAIRDGGIGEIYSPGGEYPAYYSWAYSSEFPFTWGSAWVIEALKELDLN